MTNRISSHTRWPRDLAETMDRAERDMDFVVAMMSLGFCSHSLQRVAIKAATMYVQAERRIEQELN